MSVFRAVGGGKLLSDADPKTIGSENCVRRVNVRRSDDAETLFPGWRVFGGDRLSTSVNMVGVIYDEVGMTGTSVIPGHNLEVQDIVDIDFDDGSTVVAIVEGVDGDTVEWVDSSRIYTPPPTGGVTGGTATNGQDFESFSTDSLVTQYIYLMATLGQDQNDFESEFDSIISIYLQGFSSFYGEDFEGSEFDSTAIQEFSSFEGEDFEGLPEVIVYAVGFIPNDEQDFEANRTDGSINPSSQSEQIQAYLKSFVVFEGVDFEDNGGIESYLTSGFTVFEGFEFEINGVESIGFLTGGFATVEGLDFESNPSLKFYVYTF